MSSAVSVCEGECLMVGAWQSSDCCRNASVLLIVKWNCCGCLISIATLYATTVWYDEKMILRISSCIRIGNVFFLRMRTFE